MAAKPGPKLEAVSPRLKQELLLPKRKETLTDLRFSPDGKKIVAADFSGVTAVVWDVITGKQLSEIHVGDVNFFVSTDCQTVFMRHNKTKYERVEQDGKQMYRWEFNGEVRALDLMTGQVRKTFKHQPPRGVVSVKLSPDGTKLVTSEELPGVWERRPAAVATIWDVKTGEPRALPKDHFPSDVFSPDSRDMILHVRGEDRYTVAVKSFDTATLKEKWSIPITDKNAFVYAYAASPDGKLVIGSHKVYDRTKPGVIARAWLKWWDAATGREVASFLGEDGGGYSRGQFSPNGQTLVAGDWSGDRGKLFLFDVGARKLTRTIVVEERGKEERLVNSSPVFSPDSRWIALITRKVPEKEEGQKLEPQDVAQPRIHLINVASGTIAETLIAPPAFAWSAAFSPDGRTLATGGHGKVLLWDVTKLP